MPQRFLEQNRRIIKEIIMEQTRRTSTNSIYEPYILTDIGCRNIWEAGHRTGYCFNLTINYYRGLPLSCIDQITFWVDGEQIDPEDMYIQHRGREYHYPDILKDDMATDLYWEFGGLLRVIIKKKGGIAQGIHHVKLILGTRRSYTPTMVAQWEKDMTIA